MSKKNNNMEVRKPFELMTLGKMYKTFCQLFNNKTFLQIKRNDKYEKYSFIETFTNAKNISKSLFKIGLVRQDKVGILSENSPEWMFTYMGITMCGLTAVPLDRLSAPSEIRHILHEAGVKCLFCSPNLLDDLLEILPTFKDLKFIFVMTNQKIKDSGKYKCKFYSFYDINELSKGIDDEFIYSEIEKVDLEDVASLIYTSGTTGNSKGVMLTHKNIVSDIIALYSVFGFDVNDTLLSVLPLHHTYECTCGFLTHIATGATITICPSIKPTKIVEGIKETGVTVMLGVPALFEAMANSIMKKIKGSPFLKRFTFFGMYKFVEIMEKIGAGKVGKILFRSLLEKAGLGSLKCFISGGAALKIEVGKFFEILGIDVYQGYGLTETSPVITVNTVNFNKMGSVGRAIGNTEIKIVDKDNDGIGEILVKSDMVMKGYYNNEKATKEAFDENGYFRTGDLGYLDDDGYLYITGRIKNVIVTRAGKNVYPEEIEEKLLHSDFIKEVLVVGEYDSIEKKEEIKAIIVPDFEAIDIYAEKNNLKIDNFEEVEKLIRKEVEKQNNHLAQYKRVHKIEIREEEFPKTSTRKIKRFLFQHGNN